MEKKFNRKSLRVIFTFFVIVILANQVVPINAVKPDNIPPVVTILSPTAGATVFGAVSISFEAYDLQNAIREYGIRIDGITVVTYSYTYSWDSTAYSDGSHSIEAYAYDKTVVGTDSITVTVSNGGSDTTPPVVTITSPIDGTTVSGTITISVSATDESGIATQSIFVDDVLVSSGSSYSWDTTLEQDILHTIRAEATDPSSNLGSDIISVNVNNSIAGSPFKVMAYNIKESGESATHPDWKNVVYEENADIIIFIETGYWDDNSDAKLDQYVAEFNAYFTSEDPYVGYTLQDISYSTSGAAILSRFPILETNQLLTVPLDDSSNYDVTHDFLHAIVDVYGIPIHMIGSHLKAMTGIENEERREWEQEGIINYMDNLGSVPIMYMGDLNSFSPEDYTLNTLQTGLGYGPCSMLVPPYINPETSGDFSQYQSAIHSFTDVFRTLHPTDLGITSPDYDSRIDYIYVNQQLASYILSSTTGDTAHALTGSDHLSVDAIIDLSGSGGDFIPPSVTITNPVDDSIVSDSITITVDATDDDSVVSQKILIDGIEVSTGSSYVWDTTAYSEGIHTVRAEATDPSSNVGIHQISVIVDNDGVVAIPSMVVINEYLPDPFSLFAEEWIELYNPVGEDIDLSGCKIDDLIGGGTSAYTLPGGTIISANGYLVLYQSTTGLYLNNAGDDVNLIDTDGSTVIDSHTYTSSSDDISIGRETDGASTWITFATPTPGAANTGGSSGGDVFTILINEYLPDPYVLYSTEWIELYNPSLEDVDLSGCVLDDLIGAGTSPYTISGGTIITAGGYLVFYQTTTGLALNNDGDDVHLLATDGSTIIDSHTYTSSTNDISIGRETDGASTWITFTVPTPGAANYDSGDTTPPDQVVGLSATVISESQIDLSWTSNAESDLDHYNVYRDGLLIDTVTTNSYSDVGLSPSTSYTYKISAVDTSNNEGSKSDEVSETTLADGSTPEIHVHSITITHLQSGPPNNLKYTIIVTVSVRDDVGSPVVGVSVTVELTLPDSSKKILTATTDGDGVATV
ncbi:MAG: lamin tail domain-containing protein, partial [Candidatus Heimdallarchaeota archaeon]|nr:lamin tail domain-containing protein [Candidatus Heimdallarchaeota archaeon]MCK4254262.1 lamin tail domain-containing protein [Candidatus Heimdallarchaeota archaeon]